MIPESMPSQIGLADAREQDLHRGGGGGGACAGLEGGLIADRVC